MLSSRQIIRAVVRLRRTPEAIARGVAIGVFFAFSPLIGLQIILAVFLATLIGGNRPAAIAVSWIANPLTFVPILWVIYKIGWLVLTLASGFGTPLPESLPILEGHSMAAYLRFGTSLLASEKSVLSALLVGWMICGVPAAFLSYALCRAIGQRLRLRKVSELSPQAQ